MAGLPGSPPRRPSASRHASEPTGAGSEAEAPGVTDDVQLSAAGQPAAPAPFLPRSEGGGKREIAGIAETVFVSPEEEENAIAEPVLRRVNMVHKAHQGGYKVPEGVPDTERGVGAITGALKGFPAQHEFQAVGKTASAEEREEFVRLVVAAVAEHAGAVAEEAVSVRERMGGRYTSVSVRQEVSGAQQIGLVLEELERMPQVLMNW